MTAAANNSGGRDFPGRLALDALAQARDAIRQRLAITAQAGDARRADDYASCFTEDGVLQLETSYEGREAIRRFMAAPSPIPQPISPPGDQPSDRMQGAVAGFVSHHLTTCRIDFEEVSGGSREGSGRVTGEAGDDAVREPRAGADGLRRGVPVVASARTYFLVTSAAGLDHNGYYVDALRLMGEDWLIAHRRPRTLWIAPNSLLHQRR